MPPPNHASQCKYCGFKQSKIDLHLPPARGPIERSIYCSLLPGPEVALVTPVKTTLEPSSSVLTVAVKES